MRRGSVVLLMVVLGLGLGCQSTPPSVAERPEPVAEAPEVEVEAPTGTAPEVADHEPPPRPLVPEPEGVAEDADSGNERNGESEAAFVAPEHDAGTLPRWIRHRPRAGETIEHVAYWYGVDPAKVREWNDMAEDEQPRRYRPLPVKIYAHLNPPPPVELEHEVVDGESWPELSRRYGVDSRDLRSWNVGSVGRTLEPGETVKVLVEPTIYTSILAPPPDDPRLAAVPAGAHSQGTPQDGRLIAGAAIPGGEGYSIRYPKSAFGTTTAVRAVLEALIHFREHSTYAPPIKLGTMSRPRGGQVGRHKSHQTGRDIDIRLPLREVIPQGLEVTQRRVDWLATWQLVQAFDATGDVLVIFLDYDSQKRMLKAARAAGASEEELDRLVQAPRGRSANLGLVRHEPGHDDHLHVRFRCGDEEASCR